MPTSHTLKGGNSVSAIFLFFIISIVFDSFSTMSDIPFNTMLKINATRSMGGPSQAPSQASKTGWKNVFRLLSACDLSDKEITLEVYDDISKIQSTMQNINSILQSD